MCCLFTTLLLLGPRVVGLFWWLLQPVRRGLAFNTFVWPLVALILLRWTTLMDVVVAPGKETDFD